MLRALLATKSVEELTAAGESGDLRRSLGAGALTATPGNTEPSSNHDFGAGWPHSAPAVVACSSRCPRA